MTDPKYQGQHRISQVYLREFGYFKDEKWYVSVWDKSKHYTDYVLIENFSKETNVFDLPFFENIKERRHFENKSKIIESEYKAIINTINNQLQITPRHKDLLCHYLPNLMCRTRPYRELFQGYLNSPDHKDAFLNEITMFDPTELPHLKTSLSNIPENVHLNYVTGHIINYLVRVLRNFNFIILKDHDNKGWFTSDNPVIIDTQENFDEAFEEWQWIIPVESEIYFPLSPDYCTFIFHPKSLKNKNPLRNLKTNKVHEADEQTHSKICQMIVSHTSDYFIFNQEVMPFNLAD